MVTRHGPKVHRRRKTEDPHWKAFFSEDSPADVEEARRQEVLDTSLADIGLSVRNANTLEEAGIFSVRDLSKRSRDDLLAIDNVGERTLIECRDALNKLKVPHPNWNRRARRKRRTKRKKS